MARIRSIKPEFFKHLELQELEAKNPGQNIMLVYAGLWTQCDKNGVFLYNAKVLKNEILPYMDFDMQKTLDALEKEGYFERYKSGGREYGFISNFNKYQFPSQNEKKQPAKYPEPPEKAHFETCLGTLQDVLGNDTESEGSQDNRNLDIGSQDSAAAAPDDRETADPKKLFLHYWQHTPDVFNALARIVSPKEWDNYWETAPPTPEQVKAAMENVIADVRCGSLEPRFVPRKPDKFVLNGWIMACQKRRRPDRTAPPPGLGGKKSLSGLKPIFGDGG
ncbi:MAG: hypothetical protein LBI06_05770 [Treponema sp.]|nr:hypothetical protein [Treponema sp.]